MEVIKTAISAAAFLASVSVATAAPLTYTELQLINGWTASPFGTRAPAAALDGNDIVHLKGALSGIVLNSLQPFVLPKKFRPKQDVYIAIGLINAKPGRLIIQPNGVVRINPVRGISVPADAVRFTLLEGVSYPRK